MLVCEHLLFVQFQRTALLHLTTEIVPKQILTISIIPHITEPRTVNVQEHDDESEYMDPFTDYADRIREWSNSKDLLGIFLRRGSDSFTKCEYQRIRRLISTLTNEVSLLRGPYIFLENECVATGVKKSFQIDSDPDRHMTECEHIGIVYPTEWSKRDISNPWFHYNVYQIEHNLNSFSSAPYKQNRESLLSDNQVLSFPDNVVPTSCCVGDHLLVTVEEVMENNSFPTCTANQYGCEMLTVIINQRYETEPTNAIVPIPNTAPGDLLIKIKPNGSSEEILTTNLFFLRFRFWVEAIGEPIRTLVVASRTAGSDILSFSYESSISKLARTKRGRESNRDTKIFRSSGTLSDGRKFYVYQFSSMIITKLVTDWTH